MTPSPPPSGTQPQTQTATQPAPQPDSQPDFHSEAQPPISAWLLAGGQGMRMGGLDKGLQLFQDRCLAQWVIEAIAPQVQWLGINANRHVDTYAQLPSAHPVFPDDPQYPGASGPLAGILTGLEHAPHDWLLVCPCDTPWLPPDLVPRLWQAAQRDQAWIATPCTTELADNGQPQWHPHWVCSLIHKRVYPHLKDQFVKGERKVGRMIQSMPWTRVSFDQPTAFSNFNTLESLHARN